MSRRDPATEPSQSRGPALLPRDKRMEDELVSQVRKLFETAGIDPSRLSSGDTGDGGVVATKSNQTDCDVDVIEIGIEKANELEGKEEHHELELPESFYTLIFKEKMLSPVFLLAVLVFWMSVTILVLTLVNIVDFQSYSNKLGVPPGVDWPVTAAQAVSLICGVFMEEELPESLEMIAKLKFVTKSSDGTKTIRYGLIMSLCFRITIGYLFLVTMFVLVVQTDDVVEIFFNLLALQFVEQLDDVVFKVAKKGVLGRKMEAAAERPLVEKVRRRNLHHSEKCHSVSPWESIPRAIYFLNVVILYVWFALVKMKQLNGGFYDCKTLTVEFGDLVWQDALNGNDLVYSFLSGSYKVDKNKGVNNRPAYVELNKMNDGEYKNETIPARFVYCKSEEAWILEHDVFSEYLREVGDDESECPWLFKSPKTQEYDLLSVPTTGWSVWTGQIESGETVNLSCDECKKKSDCNFGGRCNLETSKCVCDEGRFGSHCELKAPCEVIEAGINHQSLIYTAFKSDDNKTFLHSYNKPIYSLKIDEDVTLVTFAGGRWIVSYATNVTNEDIVSFFSDEYHAFWDRIYDYQTLALSDKRTGSRRSDPIGVDFSYITFKGGDYEPFGKIDTSKGRFHCKKDRCENMQKGVRGSSCGDDGILLCDDDEYAFKPEFVDFHNASNPQCICSASDGTKTYTWDTGNWGYFCENGEYFLNSVLYADTIPLHLLGLNKDELDGEENILELIDQSIGLRS